MSEIVLPSGLSPVPWVLQQVGRLVVSALAAGIGIVVTFPLPRDVALILIFDIGAITDVALVVTLMNVATPEQAAEMSSRSDPNRMRMLMLVVLLSLVSVVGVGALQNTQHDPDWLRMLHLAGSLVAIVLSWLLVHIQFGLHYMRMYYDDTTPDDGVPYDEGMAYPERKLPDYWDFMYYSFTIAMCYQTSDVTITGPTVRRITLLHAIFSFIYVVAIIGLVVNIVGNVI